MLDEEEMIYVEGGISVSADILCSVATLSLGIVNSINRAKIRKQILDDEPEESGLNLTIRVYKEYLSQPLGLALSAVHFGLTAYSLYKAVNELSAMKTPTGESN
jgi:hypothetical protein